MNYDKSFLDKLKTLNLISVLIIGMVVAWIITNLFPASVQWIAFSPSLFLKGKISSVILYPLLESSLISIVFQSLILLMIGSQFLGNQKKLINTFLIGTVGGAVFCSLLFVLFNKDIQLMSMYSFIFTLFLLKASDSPNAEVMFFFVFKMKMKTMIYISLGILFLLATVKGQTSLWASLFSMIVGFSYYKKFSDLNFLLPESLPRNIFKKKSTITLVRRNNGEFHKTNNKNNVISISKPKNKPEV